MRKNEKLIIIVVLLFQLVTVLGLIAYRYDIAIFFNRTSANLAYETKHEFALKIWSFSVRNFVYRDYLKHREIDSNLLELGDTNDPKETYKVALNVYNYAKKKGIHLDLSYLGFVKTAYEEPIDFERIIEEDDSFIEGFKYIDKGKKGKEIYEKETLQYLLNKKLGEDVIEIKLIDTVDPKVETIYEGSISKEEAISTINTSISAKEEIFILEEDTDKNALQAAITNTKVTELNLLEDAVLSEDLLNIGTARFLYETCSYYIEIDLFYYPTDQKYKLSNVEDIINNKCNSVPIAAKPVELATCIDCYLFYIDKEHSLRADYVPEVVSLADLGSDHSLEKNAFPDFKEMHNAANADGVGFYITSAYRSYETQINTFESWVQSNLGAAGGNRAQAEYLANQVSARPGFSEHQLGTTLDITGGGCSSFDRACSSNTAVWNWLRLNAHNYGFVLSYPEGKDQETGYVSEPWHYRWIGKDLALQYKAQEGALTLNKWLEDRF